MIALNEFPCPGIRRLPRLALCIGIGLLTAATPSFGQADKPAPAPQDAAKPPAASPTTPPAAAKPDDKNAKPPDFSKGALYGRVLDTATGKPVPDATVALQDKDGKVVAWTKTNAQGEYAIGADTMKVLGLRPSKRGGLLLEVVKAVGDVVTAPVKAVGAVVKDPVGTAKNVAVSAATGNPLPVATQLAAPSLTKAPDPKQLAQDAKLKATETSVKSVLGERQATPADKRNGIPGEIQLVIIAPNYKECKGQAGAYWLEPPDEEAAKGEKKIGPRAWLETVKLAPAAAPADKKSEVAQEAYLIGEPKIEPTLVPAGGTMKISAKLQTPPGPARKIRVFAREDKKHAATELKLVKDNLYEGQLALDPKTPSGETTISIVALREEPLEVKLNQKKADPLLEFVKRLDDLDADKPYDYDPRIMASENRIDVKITVLDPKQGTPAVDGKNPPPAADPKTPPPADPNKKG